MLKVETEKNTYLFDNSSGYVIPIGGKKHKTENEDETFFDCKSDLLDKYKNIGAFSEYIVPEEYDCDWNEKTIYNQISSSMFSNLQLVLTENCNFRCEYCMYSEKYPNHMNFMDCSMTEDIAKRSVDLFAEIARERASRGTTNEPSITFYGGEPLLEFELIEKVVAYSKKKIKDVTFGISTNASLLTDKMIKFMVNNCFTLAISLDGYKLNHDRNRKLRNGEASFDIVWERIKRIREIDKGNKIRIVILCCVDKYTNLLRLADFFYENYDWVSPWEIRINPVNQLDTTYYEYCDKKYEGSDLYKVQEQNKSLKLLRERLVNQYYGAKTSKILSPFFYSEMNLMIGNKGSKKNSLNNSCIPGSKITILPTGKIAPCEKTGNNFIIGDVVNGLDYKYIKTLVWEFSKLMGECRKKKCPIRRICGACFAFMYNSKRIQEGFCELELKSKKAMLQVICETLENNSKFYRQLQLYGNEMDNEK